MRIGELSKRTGVSCDALRLYEKRGLIRSERHSNGYRDFDTPVVELVGMIRLGQSLGFTLAEMSDLLAQMNGSMDGERVAEVLGRKLVEIDLKIDGLRQLRGILAARIAAACPLGIS